MHGYRGITRRSPALLSLCTLALLLGAPLAAQTENLSQAQLATYNRLRLSVEPIGMAVGSVGYSTLQAESWTRWVAYEGFTPIREAEFFHKIGYAREAERAARYHARSRQLAWGGLGATAVGLGLVVASAAAEDEALALAGFGLSLTGLVPAMIGAIRIRTNWAPYSTVSGMAEQYNRALQSRIIEQF